MGGSTYARAINDSGQIAGYSEMPINPQTRARNFHAFLYDGKKISDLGTLGGPSSKAAAINVKGQVVGEASVSNGVKHAFLYSGGQMRDLGVLLGYTDSSATDINDRGDVIGVCEGKNYKLGRAFLYTAGKMLDLGTFHGAPIKAIAVDERCRVLCYSNGHSCIYDKGQLDDLEFMTGSRRFMALNWNKQGDILGIGATGRRDERGNATSHTFIYHANKMTDIGLFGEDFGVEGVALNNYGVVVGEYKYGSNYEQRIPFVYASGKIHPLHSIVLNPDHHDWGIEYARAVNNRGQIIVDVRNYSSSSSNSYRHQNNLAILLTPIDSRKH